MVGIPNPAERKKSFDNVFLPDYFFILFGKLSCVFIVKF